MRCITGLSFDVDVSLTPEEVGLEPGLEKDTPLVIEVRGIGVIAAVVAPRGPVGKSLPDNLGPVDARPLLGKEYGSSNQNMLPLPNSLSTPSLPFESLTIWRTSARPRPDPLPPCLRPISVWTYGENNRLLKASVLAQY